MNSIQETIERALSAAGLSDRESVVRKTISSALTAAGLQPHRAESSTPMPESTARQAAALLTEVGGVYELDEADERIARGFHWHSYTNGAGTLRYKLFVPSTHRGGQMPLLVMLHGCKQNPDDFAAGTDMNALAEQGGFLVAYPAQATRDNGSNCWNWFEPAQQQRTGREPSLIAGMVGDIAGRMPADRAKVFVAGLSAGGAMAVVLGHHYPEVFSGVAVHSGLPLGAADDVQSAFAAMRGQSLVGSVPRHVGLSPRTIVFHGDADATVVPSNGRAVVLQAKAALEENGVSLRERSWTTSVNGRACDLTDFVDEQGRVMVREWRVRGGGHAWFGGDPKGSYTDPMGPAASAELLRFFMADWRSEFSEPR